MFQAKIHSATSLQLRYQPQSIPDRQAMSAEQTPCQSVPDSNRKGRVPVAAAVLPVALACSVLPSELQNREAGPAQKETSDRSAAWLISTVPGERDHR